MTVSYGDGGDNSMTVRYIGDAQWTALDADAKPTNASVADTLTTLDTRRIFIHQGSARVD